MFEVDEAAKIITESVDRDANIIFGTTINDDYTGELKITVVATGFDEETNKNFTPTTQSKISPFGRKVDNKPAFQSNSFTQAPSAPKVESQGDDLDVPAFLRKKI